MSDRVLAIGIDAAEPSLVREMLDRGELPSLQQLLSEGFWCRVDSSAAIGSGTVWPAFITGQSAARHGVYSEWSWQPDRMALVRCSGSDLPPFWQREMARGATVGLLDVPFAPFLGVERGFEISEWAAHDALVGRTRISPAGLASVIDEFPPEGIGIEGVRARGRLARRLLRDTACDLAVVIFPEVHDASHLDWDTVADSASPIRSLLREVDAQVGAIAEDSDYARVVVFSMHGMRGGKGIASLLQPLLIQRGYATVTDWSSQSWRERRLSLFASMKKRSPRMLKDLYYRALPAGATHRLAQPTLLPLYDWSRTRAFALPSDQHGWIRINLAGREANGIVPPDDFENLRDELEELLRSDARVKDVQRSSSPRLPDLVVHWEETALEPLSSGKRQTGQHAEEGFLIGRGVGEQPSSIRGEEIHRLLSLSASEPLSL